MKWLLAASMTISLIPTIWSDEINTGHLPIKYSEAEDIIRKAHIDGKAKHWTLPPLALPPNSPLVAALKLDKKSITEQPVKDEEPRDQEEDKEEEHFYSHYQEPPPRSDNEPFVEYINPTRK